MSIISKTGPSAIDDGLAISEENHQLYFPSFDYEGRGNTVFFRANQGFYEEDILAVSQLYKIKQRLTYNEERADNICLGSNKFVERFLTAANILIIDTHIDKSFFRYIEHILECNCNFNLRKIEIISCRPDTSEHFHNVLNIMKEKKISFKMYVGLKKDLIHDRFILFDKELWHFGGTVGGIQKGLTAFSTGWYNCDLESLFNELINEESVRGI